MRRIFVFATLLIIAILQSCQKEPVDDAVESFWRLTEYTLLPEEQIYSVKERYITITPQLVMLTTNSDKDNTRFIARMEYEDGGLRWYNFYVMLTTHDSGEPAKIEKLAPWGIMSDDNHFHIEKRNGKELWLRSQQVLLKMERY